MCRCSRVHKDAIASAQVAVHAAASLEPPQPSPALPGFSDAWCGCDGLPEACESRGVP